MKRSISIALAALAILGVSTLATEARAHSEQESGSLASTGVDPDARGKVKLTVRNLTDGRLDIKGQKLDPNATFAVLVDRVLVGQFPPTGGGNGRIRFRSRPRSPHDQLLGFDPRGALVVVRNAAGQDVLAVQLADSGSVNPGDVVCCIPDASGAECEDRTAEECAMQGGTVSTATSCLPNPCAGEPPPAGDVVCCIPDDAGPERHDPTPTPSAPPSEVRCSSQRRGACTSRRRARLRRARAATAGWRPLVVPRASTARRPNAPLKAAPTPERAPARGSPASRFRRHRRTRP